MDGSSLPYFSGSDYEPKSDFARLQSQLLTIKNIVLDGEFHTLRELSRKTGFMDSSVSRYLRYLRAERFGGFLVEKRVCGDRKLGLFEYRVSKPVAA